MCFRFIIFLLLFRDATFFDTWALLLWLVWFWVKFLFLRVRCGFFVLVGLIFLGFIVLQIWCFVGLVFCLVGVVVCFSWCVCSVVWYINGSSFRAFSGIGCVFWYVGVFYLWFVVVYFLLLLLCLYYWFVFWVFFAWMCMTSVWCLRSSVEFVYLRSTTYRLRS